MTIGGLDAKRDIVVYPSKLDFNLNASIISPANECFISVTGIQMDMEGCSSYIVGIEAGFSK
jgi:hypothetical protein